MTCKNPKINWNWRIKNNQDEEELTMHPKAKAPQEPTVKARMKALVEAFDISDRSEVDDSEGEDNNETSSAIFSNTDIINKITLVLIFFQGRISL